MTQKSEKPRVYVVLHNHYDPIWRRCWKRDFTYKGRRYRPYAHIEEEVFKRWLEIAEKGEATISEGQAVVLRTYIEKHPDKLPLLRKLVKEGRLEVTAAGEVVPDLNLPCGEALVRNYVLGTLWCEEVLGARSEVGWLEDAFGQSAQVPQILRGVGAKYAARLSYAFAQGDFWKGLDGSVVLKKVYERVDAGSNIKYRPCPDCQGYGCTTCHNTGVQDDGGISDRMILNSFQRMKFEEHDVGLYNIGNEEHYPNPKSIELIEEARKKYPHLDIRWGTYADILEEYKDDLARLDDPDLETSGDVEGNPSSSGTHVTRIKTKQWNRYLETILLQAEQLATYASLEGSEYPKADLLKAWQDLVFTQFHDAITATHLDACYDELEDMFRDIESIARKVLHHSSRTLTRSIKTDAQDGAPVVVFNTHNWSRTDRATATVSLDQPLESDQNLEVVDEAGHAQFLEPIEQSFRGNGAEVTVHFIATEVPANGHRTFYARPVPQPRAHEAATDLALENEFFKVAFDNRGITAITDKSTGKGVTAKGDWRPNDLTLEDDYGNPWGTKTKLTPMRSTGEFVTSVERHDHGQVQRVVVKGYDCSADPDVHHLAWIQTIELRPHVPRIEFRTEIDWDTLSRRVRVVFPLDSDTSEARWEIPYGNLVRGPYEPRYHNNGVNGDWPAIRWVDVALKDGNGVALYNRGLPSYRVDHGTVMLSLLRSPQESWCLNEPEWYDCPDYDGALDKGNHVFEYALMPHKGDYKEGEVIRHAWDYNHPLVAQAARRHDGAASGSYIELEGKGVVLSAVKRAEQSDDLVIRAYEAEGSASSASLRLNNIKGEVQTARLDEKEAEKANAKKIPFRAFEIKTIVVKQ